MRNAFAARADELSALHHAVMNVRAQVAAGAQATLDAWKPLADVPLGANARNLAEYLSLRRIDMSALQARLARFGLSSLGRSEAHVMGSLDAVTETLAQLCGRPEPLQPPLHGVDLLEAATDRLFGPRTGRARA